MDIRGREDLPAMPMTIASGIHEGVVISNSTNSTNSNLNINLADQTQLKVESASPSSPSNCNVGPEQSGRFQFLSNGGSAMDANMQDTVRLGRKPVKYKECLKNHAANIGGHATDGCGEFMANGDEGTLETLQCAACGCHRNFHRREVDGEMPFRSSPCDFGPYGKHIEPLFPAFPARPHMASLPALPPPTGPLMHHHHHHIHRQPTPPQMIMAFNTTRGPDSDEFNGSGGFAFPQSQLRKRFRTKFTAEQKEQMWEFSEKLGWRIQKQDEEAVMQFCADVGVKRHVLKVWMHNNKNTLGKRLAVLPDDVNACTSCAVEKLSDEDVDEDIKAA